MSDASKPEVQCMCSLIRPISNVKQARAAGLNFNGTTLREKALEISDKLGINDFEESNW